MMGSPNQPLGDLLQLATKGLELHVQKKLTDDYVRNAVAKFERELREQIEPMISTITIKSIHSYKDLRDLHEQVDVNVNVEVTRAGA